MMSSNLLPSSAHFSFSLWTQKACDKTCVAKNLCTDKVEGTRVFSWWRNKSPMQHFSECFCHIVLNMAQNIWVDMLIHRISLYDVSAMHNSMNVRKQSACCSYFTQTCLAYLKYRDDGLFQRKECCKQCDNSERGCVPITAFPQGPDTKWYDSCIYQSASNVQNLATQQWSMIQMRFPFQAYVLFFQICHYQITYKPCKAQYKTSLHNTLLLTFTHTTLK
jgi:hypothetical protein